MTARMLQGICILLLIVANFIIWKSSMHADSHVLTVSFLDVGQGDAIFIETPSGVQFLVDGGPDESVLRELGAVMPAWDRTLDAILVTHPDKDHVGGIPDVLRRFRVETIFMTGVDADTPTFSAFEEYSAGEKAVIIEARRGQIIDLGDGVRLTVLYPDERNLSRSTNDTSVVARLDYGETSLLLTGDIEESVEEYLLSLDDKLLDTDVLKVAHHGSKTSSSVNFVAAVTPALAVISAGADNSYGHPHAVTMDTIDDYTADIRCTCEKGRIILKSNGREWTQ